MSTPSVQSAQEFIAAKSDAWKTDRDVLITGTDGEKGLKFERESFAFLPASDNPQKVFSLERIRRGKEEHVRVGYWIVSRHGAMSGRWCWGRFAPMMSEEDFGRLAGMAL